MSILSPGQIAEMGFAHVGEGARLSDKASYYNCSKISIGSYSRIDDFCVVSAGSGGIFIGNYVHLAVSVSLIGAGTITLSDFSGISGRVSIYSSSDDFSGQAMTNPTIPSEFTNVFHADVTIGRHVVVGVASVILPGVSIAEGAAVGALSLVKNDCQAFMMYAGVPAKAIAERKKNLLELEQLFFASIREK